MGSSICRITGDAHAWQRVTSIVVGQVKTIFYICVCGADIPADQDE